jgi:hypothetical protein
MRNLSKSPVMGSSVGVPLSASTQASRGLSAVGINKPANTPVSQTHTSPFSQLSRSSVMQKNIRQVSLFMDAQQSVIRELIKEFQIFVGYIEQLPKRGTDLAHCNSWSVYLMHAQSLHSAMKQTHQGKALFGDGASPPVRVHLEEAGSVVPFDLPDPSLVSMISVRAFLSGVADHKLPSIELGNACMAELLNALMDIHQGRERLSSISRNLKKSKSLSITQNNQARPVHMLAAKSVSWHEKFIMQIQSIFSPTPLLKQRG